MAEAKRELQRILARIQGDFIAHLRAERLDLDQRLETLVEGRGIQQAQLEPRGLRRRADPLQGGFHGDRQNGGGDFGDFPGRGNDADDPAIGEILPDRGALRAGAKKRQTGPERKNGGNPQGTAHAKNGAG